MRSPYRRQAPLIAPRTAHARARELADIDQLLEDTPALAKLVAADLPHAPGASNSTGRPGLTGDQVLRASIVRSIEGCSYDDLAFHLSDSQTYRWFCRLGWGEGSPSSSTLQENIRRVKPETWEAVNRAIVGRAVELGIETGEKTRIDCTVTKANIHPPGDAAQLYDVVRVVVRLLQRARKLRKKVTVHKRMKRAKRRYLETMTKKKEPRTVAYRDLLKVTGEVLDWARAAVPMLRVGASPGDPANQLADELLKYIGLGDRVVDQTRRRVIDGEKVPAGEKVLSIFEPHTDIIIKDKREVLYGHKLLVATGARGLVQYCDVLKGNPADSTLVGPALDGVTEALGRVPRQAAMDGGFASQEGLALAKTKGVKDVCFSKRRGMKIKDMCKSEWVYRRLWRFRVGVEAGISWLKRCFGLGRCAWKGEDGFSAYVQANVAAFNLFLLGRLTSA
jgi:IS5 family transposase